MPNRLASETSPYLLQHADNPVDWYPWGEEALILAQRQNKPILLSVGYSACHWCHVMAHECFEDEEVAAAMNRYFVNIKVDREERPDIDQIYQMALYMLTRRNGGWPLTLFLTPQQKPFFGGTYFPKTSRHGVPGFLELLPRVAETYRVREMDIEQQSASLLKSFANLVPDHSGANHAYTEKPLHQALAELENRFDHENGGFGNAPKFLHPAELEFCLRRYFATSDSRSLHMAAFTLQKMAKGGIYDQLGGGFFRYSTDPYWHVPHFEKMLYDNGSLLKLYTDAWIATGNPLFQGVVEETAGWVLREMQPSGQEGRARGYFSTIDADSENEEGKFYVWDRDQVSSLLPPQEYVVAAPYYGLTREPNFEHRRWNLEIVQTLEEIAGEARIGIEDARNRLSSAHARLFLARQQRVHPGRDEKILTSWNGLMIKGMARAARVFGRGDWIRSAASAADFVRDSLWKNNRLLATCKDGRVHLNAYLDDYVFMLDALLELMQTEFRPTDLDFAVALADVLLEQFEDRRSGGFFFTSHEHEKLIHRPKSGHDNALPSGNGVAAYALQGMGHLLGEFRYLDAAERTLRLFYNTISRYPSSCCSLLIGLGQSIAPPKIVILRGDAPALTAWKNCLRRRGPGVLVFALPSELTCLPPAMDKASPSGDAVNAWACEGVKCVPQILDLHELLRFCEIKGNIGFPIYN